MNVLDELTAEARHLRGEHYCEVVRVGWGDEGYGSPPAPVVGYLCRRCKICWRLYDNNILDADNKKAIRNGATNIWQKFPECNNPSCDGPICLHEKIELTYL